MVHVMTEHTTDTRSFWHPEHSTGQTEYFVMYRENHFEDARWAPLNTSNGDTVHDLAKARGLLASARSEHEEVLADLERQVRAAISDGDAARAEERTSTLAIERETVFMLFTRRTSPVSPVSD